MPQMIQPGQMQGQTLMQGTGGGLLGPLGGLAQLFQVLMPLLGGNPYLAASSALGGGAGQQPQVAPGQQQGGGTSTAGQETASKASDSGGAGGGAMASLVQAAQDADKKALNPPAETPAAPAPAQPMQTAPIPQVPPAQGQGWFGTPPGHGNPFTGNPQPFSPQTGYLSLPGWQRFQAMGTTAPGGAQMPPSPQQAPGGMQGSLLTQNPQLLALAQALGIPLS